MIMMAEMVVMLCGAVLLLASSGLSDTDTVIAVVNTNTSADSNSSCVSGADSQCTLSELQHYLTSNTEVRLCSKQLLLETVITIREASSITIVSYESPVVVLCPSTQAGINFTEIRNLTLLNFEIVNCGFQIDMGSFVEKASAAVSIHQCMDVTLANVNVTGGLGVGLALLDVYGKIGVTDSNFARNGHDIGGGSGLYITWSGTHNQGPTTEVKVRNCQFLNNTASKKAKHSTGQDREELNMNGGGMYINASHSSNMHLSITDSTFIGNNASNHYGGGIFVSFSHTSDNSLVEIRGSNFSCNHAKFGGAMHAEYAHGNTRQFHSSINSSFIFISNNFEDNSAVFGGAISLFSIKSTERYAESSVIFENCSLTKNRAQYGSAVAILPDTRSAYTHGYLPEPVIKDCRIFDNVVIKSHLPYARNCSNQYMRGAGALYCFRHTLTLEGENRFTHNKGSAMYLGFSSVILSQNSVTNFTNNSAYYGGAMHLLVSVLYLDRDTRVYFVHNRANGKGGAIYEESPEIHMVDYSQTCFIDLLRAGLPSENNISVAFDNNQVGSNITNSNGNSIYTTSILPCCREFGNCENMSQHDIFKTKIGNFSYLPSNRSNEIVTDVNHANFRDCNMSSKALPFIPGKEVRLPHTNLDDFNHTTSASFLVTIKHSHTVGVNISSEFSEISGNTLKLYGSSINTAKVTLSSTSFRKIALEFDVEMKPCPPGYILHFDKVTKLVSCICSVDTDDQYKGIVKCNSTLMQAYRNPNYWIGYNKSENESEDTLWSGHCPNNFCSLSSGTLLPETASRAAMCDLTCSDNREGVLCGRCKEHSSVHYHSLTLHCRPSKYCHLGWLFYILSEILPVTVIFLVVLYFNVSFTSGVVNSFVFFSQVLMTPRFTAKGFLPGVHTIMRYGRSVYLFFSLDVFVLDEISYCLWNSASALDILSFSYITMIYSLLLVILVVFIRNKGSVRRCQQGASRSKSRGSSWFTLQGNIIHGLSSFLVLFSSHCVKVSIMILTPSQIYNKRARRMQSVVHYNGEINWMSTRHLPYAIPAIVMLIAILMPSTLLLIYPLHYRILSILKLSERRFPRKIFGPLERLKPFFDSFQGSFKDNMRFFSGLYFMYRYLFLMIVVWMVINDAYFLQSMLLGFILTIHSVAQPYRERLHNIIDMLLLGNLTLINLMSAYDVSKASATGSISSISAILTLWGQVLLTHLPLFCVLVYYGRKACLAVYKRMSGTKRLDLDSQPSEYESSTSVLEHMDYGTF